jgi:hypothetical protein
MVLWRSAHTVGDDWVHTSPHICGTVRRYQSPSLARELLYRRRPSSVSSVARSMPGLSSPKSRRWQITNDVSDCGNGSDLCNNGIELASEHNVQPRRITRRHSQQEQEQKQPTNRLTTAFTKFQIKIYECNQRRKSGKMKTCHDLQGAFSHD